MFAITFEAAATDMRSLLRSSYKRHCFDNTLSQYTQSAAPPAIVAENNSWTRNISDSYTEIIPSKKLLISIIFLTVCEPIKSPPVALESTESTTPPWYLKPRVVVPWSNLILISLPDSSVLNRPKSSAGWFFLQKLMKN